MTTRMEVAARLLTVHLPESVVVTTRGEVVDSTAAVLACGGVDRVRLDASDLVTLDAGGISALVRIARISREHTGERPLLAHCSPEIQEALTETAVLPLLLFLEV
jgi:hypothetical protein